MKRNIRNLENKEFDLLIVGGGIYGATTAREAALRGLKVALIERGDFGHATSANSLKVIHGGLRYLQHGDFRRMRRSISARRELLRIAPHLVHPLKFVMPTYGHLLKGREAMALALGANDLIGWDRNRLLNQENYLPRSRTISRTQCLQYLPDIDKKGLSGGAVWYDCIAQNTERLTLEFVLAADYSGACVANYVEAVQPVLKGNSVVGVKAKDAITDRGLEIRSKIMVNAAGPWINEFLNFMPSLSRSGIEWAKAVNVFVNKPLFDGYAVGVTGKENYTDKDSIIKRDKRLFFIVPWQSGSMVGTTYEAYTGDSRDCRVKERDIVELLDEINFGYPTANLNLGDVSFCHAGLVPIFEHNVRSERDIQLVKKSVLLDHEKESRIKGIITLNGVKYTTAIELAKDTVDLCVQKLGLENRNHTDHSLLPGALNNFTEHNTATQDSPKPCILPGTIDHLERVYGAQYTSMIDIVQKEGGTGKQIWQGHPTIQAEILHAIREEMAQCLPDVVLRRTELGTTGSPSTEAIKKCAEIMGQELNWENKRRQSEIDSVQKAFKF